MLKKSIITRTVLVFLASLMLLFVNTSQAEAGQTITCYPIYGKIPVYSKVYGNPATVDTGTKCGTIFISDAVTILYEVGTAFRVRYPISGGGTRDGFIPAYRVLDYGGTNAVKCFDKFTKTAYANSTIYTYMRPNGPRCGSVYAGDYVYIYRSLDGYTQVLYPTSNGKKLAWIRSSELWKLGVGGGKA